MRAIGYTETLPISSPTALERRDVAKPTPGSHDVLIRVEAVAVNPIDTKQRRTVDPDGFRILGYDAYGVVEAVGEEVTRCREGDRVMAIGTLTRPGTNAEYFVVHEHMTALAPERLGERAAALPLTMVTAWECLFEKLGLTDASTGRLLVIGATGGVGIAALQLAKIKLPHVEVIATAASPEREQLVRSLGAREVVNHHEDLTSQVAALAPEGVDWVLTAHSQGQEHALAAMVRPRGAIVGIDVGPDSIAPLKAKSLTWHWESMFTKSIFDVELESQGAILDEVSRMAQLGDIEPVIEDVLGPICVETLRKGHERMEAGNALGKIVVRGWESES